MPKRVHSGPGIVAGSLPFSPVIEAHGLVFLAGQVGDVPGTPGPVRGGIEAETRAMLDNVGRLLKAVGLDYKDVVKATVYLRDFDEFAAMNAVRTQKLNPILERKEQANREEGGALVAVGERMIPGDAEAIGGGKARDVRHHGAELATNELSPFFAHSRSAIENRPSRIELDQLAVAHVGAPGLARGLQLGLGRELVVMDAEQPHDLEVLPRLRHDGLVRGDHE